MVEESCMKLYGQLFPNQAMTVPELLYSVTLNKRSATCTILDFLYIVISFKSVGIFLFVSLVIFMY